MQEVCYAIHIVFEILFPENKSLIIDVVNQLFLGYTQLHLG